MSLLNKIPPTPLVYPEIIGTNRFTNVLLIDSQVKNYQLFVDSANSSTFHIVYSIMSSKTELLALLQNNFTTDANFNYEAIYQFNQTGKTGTAV